jgi:hypothetical protein
MILAILRIEPEVPENRPSLHDVWNAIVNTYEWWIPLLLIGLLMGWVTWLRVRIQQRVATIVKHAPAK